MNDTLAFVRETVNKLDVKRWLQEAFPEYATDARVRVYTLTPRRECPFAPSLATVFLDVVVPCPPDGAFARRHPLTGEWVQCRRVSFAVLDEEVAIMRPGFAEHMIEHRAREAVQSMKSIGVYQNKPDEPTIVPGPT